MKNDQALIARAKQIDPCAFKSFSGSARRDAQRIALEQARRELERELECKQPFEQRRYTIDEIDRMRVAIKRVQPPSIRYGNEPTRCGFPSIEDQLRTAMLGGVSPQELEDKADLHWERIRERRAAREAEADAARVRAGGCAIVNKAIEEVKAEAVVADVPMNSFWKRTLVSRIVALLSRGSA